MLLGLFALALLASSAALPAGSGGLVSGSASEVVGSEVPAASAAAAGFAFCFSSAGGPEVPGVSSSFARRFQLSFIEDSFLLICDL